MGNILNDDFKDFLIALNKADVKYMLVGGYAVIFHGYNRTTGDLDIWVEAMPENYSKLLHAFRVFGMSPFEMTEERFCNPSNQDVFTFGSPPVCIEILTQVSGLNFETCYPQALKSVWDSVPLSVIDIRSLKINKRASGRFKDLDDLEQIGDL
jgi:hypothetical protein